MGDQVRKPVWLYQKHWDMLQAVSDEHDRTASWTLRNLLDKIVQVAKNTGMDPMYVLGAPDVHLTCTQGEPEVPCPDPAPAPVSSSLPLPSLEKEEGIGAEIARLLTELDWRGAALPKSASAVTFAMGLLEAFPGIDIPKAIHRAHVHQLALPKPKVALGRFITNWLDNEENPPAWKVAKQAAAKAQQTSIDAIWNTNKRKEQPHERRKREEQERADRAGS